MSTAGKFNKLERLGDGTYGVVYKAESKHTKDIVALKRMNPAPEEEGVPATTIREIALLKELRHPNVVTLKDLMFEAPKLTLIFEYCEWDLKKLMDSKGTLELDEIRHFLKQLLEGLAYCHHRSVVHRDLKPQNLLIEDSTSETKKFPAAEEQLKDRDYTELVLKLADFGLARVEGIPVKKYSHEAVTLWYRSPDVILGSTNYGLPVDMWSVGCIFAEMASGVPIFNAKNDHDQLVRMFKILGSPTRETWPSMSTYPNARTMLADKPNIDRYPPNLSEYCRTHNISRLGDEGLDLLEKMLRFEPSQRVTAVDALRHPFFGGSGATNGESSRNSSTTAPSTTSPTVGGTRRASGNGDIASSSKSAASEPRRSSSSGFNGDGGDKADGGTGSGSNSAASSSAAPANAPSRIRSTT